MTQNPQDISHKSLGSFEREVAIQRYVKAMDDGDAEAMESVLQLAVYDVLLDAILAEIDSAFEEEWALCPGQSEKQLVQELVRRHLPSAFEPVSEPTLTVGQVASQLQAKGRVPFADREAHSRLLSESTPLPTWLSMNAVNDLAARLEKQIGIVASARFWRAFRDAAVMLGKSRVSTEMQMALPREERTMSKPVTPPTSKSAIEKLETEEEQTP